MPTNCQSCLRPLPGLTADQPQICQECWNKMTPGERANYMQMRRLSESIDGLAGKLGDVVQEAQLERESDGGDSPFPWRN